MLVLSRKLQEQIKIGEEITVTVLRVKGNTVRVGIEAPKCMRVIRAELPKRTSATDSAATEGEATEAVVEIIGPADSLTIASAEEPVQRVEEPKISPSPMLLSLRRLRNRRTAAPLKQVAAACAALAK